jgi:hypothetical protein
MLNTGILDTLVLYTLAAIGASTVISKFYHSLELYFCLLSQNVEYYLPSVHQVLLRWFPRFPRSSQRQPPLIKTQEQMQTEVMDDILSKTERYYDSIKETFESQIKSVPDTQLRNKLDQWYQSINKMVETNDKSPSPKNVKDLKKRMSECADEIFQVLGCSSEVQKDLDKYE